MNGKRSVVVDVVDGRIWISSVGGGVWSSGGQAWDVVSEVVESLELWNVAWKCSRSVVVVEGWNDQAELEHCLKVGLVMVEW